MDVRKVIGAVVVAAGVGGYLPGVPGLIGGADPIDDPPDDLALTDDTLEAERPPAPPVVELPEAAPADFEDGLVRLVVTPTGDAADWLPVTDALEAPPASTPTPETTTEPSAAPDPTPTTPPAAALLDIPVDPSVDQTTIDPRLLDLLVVSAVLTFDEFDRPWAQWSDGTRLPLWSLDEWPLDLLIALGLVEDPSATPPAAPTSEDVAPDPTPTAEPEPEPEPPIVSVGHPVMDAIAAAAGVDSVRSVGDGSFAVALEDPTLLDDFPVEVAEDTLMAIDAEPYESYQWALENSGENLDGVSGAPPQDADADVDGAEARTAATGAGVVVAVVDSGVDFGHPDLAPNRWQNPDEVCDNGLDDDANGFVDDCHGWDFAYDDNTPWNPGAHAHGTHVAGIIGAAENGDGVVGIAPNVHLMDLNVGAITPSGQPGITTTAVARAIRYAADNGADIINLSLGTPPGSPRQGSAPVEQAILHAESRGVVVVAAAGNDGTNLDLAPGWPASYEFSNMITVGASTPTDSRAGFSNYGAVVDVFAPGVLILSSMPNGELSFMSGTSQATPVVAGAAALALEARPGRTPSDVRGVLTEHSDRNEALAPFVAGGVRVNAGALVGVTDIRHSISEVMVEATGLAGANEGQTFTMGLSIAMPEDHPTDPLEWEMTLLTIGDDATYGVVDHPVSIEGISVSTDGRGSVGLGLTSSGVVDVGLALPAGDYAVVLEAVPDDDPASRIGDARVVRFAVASAPVEPSPEPGDPTSPGEPPRGDDPGPAEPTQPSDPTNPDLDEPPGTDPGDNPGSAPGATPPGSGDATTPPADDASPPPADAGPDTSPPPSDVGDTPTDPSPPTGPGSGADPAEPAPADPSIPAPVPGDPSPPEEPLDPAPGREGSGDWSIRSISPSEGPVDLNNVVELRGSFPRAAYVWFGASPGTVLLQTADVMVVLTPASPTPGTVNVELRQTGAGSVATMIGGYTFVDPFAPGAPTAPAPGDGGGTPADGAPDSDPPSTPDAGDGGRTPSEDNDRVPGNGDRPDLGDRGPGNCGVSDSSGDNGRAVECPDGPSAGGGTEAPDDPPAEDPDSPDPAPTPSPTDPIGSEPNDPADGDPVPSNRQPRLGMAADVGALTNGLSGVRVVSGDPSGSASVCQSSPCRLD